MCWCGGRAGIAASKPEKSWILPQTAPSYCRKQGLWSFCFGQRFLVVLICRRVFVCLGTPRLFGNYFTNSWNLLKKHLMWGVFCGFFFSNPSCKCWPSTSPSVKLLPLSCVWAFCVLVPGPVEPQLQAHGFFPKCCCERSWCNAGVDPAGIDIPGMFSHPPSRLQKILEQANNSWKCVWEGKPGR